MLLEHHCKGIRETFGYVSLSSGDSVRTRAKHLEVTCIFKARTPTNHREETLRQNSGAIQFLGVRKRRGSGQWDFRGGVSEERESQETTLSPFLARRIILKSI